MSERRRAGDAGTSGGGRIYDLEVLVIAGPATDDFIEKNPVLSRTIRIRGGQTLETLHEAIFEAFDRFDHHMYEFQVGGTKPFDRKARRYALVDDGMFDEERAAGLVGETTVDDLDLRKGCVLFYWFDFGDDWWHKIKVVGVEADPGGPYPQVIARVGDSPPQYPDWDDEEDSY